jgi:hypothetical protein
MAAKLARLTHKIPIQLHLVAEICTICSSRSRPVSPETFGYTLVVCMGRLKTYTAIQLENLKRREHLDNIKMYLKYYVREWIGFIRLGAQTSGGFLRARK